MFRVKTYSEIISKAAYNSKIVYTFSERKRIQKIYDSCTILLCPCQSHCRVHSLITSTESKEIIYKFSEWKSNQKILNGCSILLSPCLSHGRDVRMSLCLTTLLQLESQRREVFHLQLIQFQVYDLASAGIRILTCCDIFQRFIFTVIFRPFQIMVYTMSSMQNIN